MDVVKDVCKKRNIKTKVISHLKMTPVMDVINSLDETKNLLVIYEGSDTIITYNLLMSINVMNKTCDNINNIDRSNYSEFILVFYKGAGFYIKHTKLSSLYVNSFIDDIDRIDNHIIECNICMSCVDSTIVKTFTCGCCYKTICYDCCYKNMEHTNDNNGTDCPFCKTKGFTQIL